VDAQSASEQKGTPEAMLLRAEELAHAYIVPSYSDKATSQYGIAASVDTPSHGTDPRKSTRRPVNFFPLSNLISVDKTDMVSDYKSQGWTDVYSVNIKLFDTQHRRLVELIARLEKAMSEGRGTQAVYEILLDLVDYCTQHFATEEAVMTAYDFPLRDKHTLEHNKFLESVRTLQVQCASGEAAISVHVLDHLRTWLSEHVLGSDKKYTEHLNSRGMF
jgi:hemerythrin